MGPLLGREMMRKLVSLECNEQEKEEADESGESGVCGLSGP
jgi:hypothetical protein